MVSRWLPLSGVVFVVLMLVVIVGVSGETPGTSDTGAEIASFYSDESGRQGVTAFLLAATVPFLLLFAACLAGTARTFLWPASSAFLPQLVARQHFARAVTWNTGRQGDATPSLAMQALMGWWESEGSRQ